MGLIGETLKSSNQGRDDSGKATYDVKLKWSPLLWADSNGPITGYVFFWRESLLVESEYENATTAETYFIFRNTKENEK